MNLIEKLDELATKLNGTSCSICPYRNGCRDMSNTQTGGYSLCYLLGCVVEALESKIEEE